MKRYGFAASAMGLLLLFCTAGCLESSTARDRAHTDAEAEPDGGKFLLVEEPGGVMCVSNVRDALPSDQDVAVLGRIGGIDDPWTPGEASFVMSDPALISLGEDDHECGDDCPYCAKKQKEQMKSMAFVQIVDEEGRVLRTDARKLLGIQEDQMIVVRGRASLNRSGHIVIAATGLYVRE